MDTVCRFARYVPFPIQNEQANGTAVNHRDSPIAAATIDAAPIDQATGKAQLPTPQSMRQRIGGLQGQAFLAVLLKAMAAVSALLLQWLIARFYGPQGTGLFALMATTVTFIGICAVWGQDYISLRNVAGELAAGHNGDARAYASASARVAAIGTIIGSVAVIVLAFFYRSGVQSQMALILMLATPVVAGISLGRTYAFVARAGGRIISSQLPDGPITSTVSVSLLVAAALAWGRPPLWTLGAVYGAAYFAALIFAFSLYRRVSADWATLTLAKPLRPLFVAGIPLVLANASPYLADWMIIFTSTSLFSANVAGQIRIVTLFLSVMFLVTIAFDAVLAPSMASALKLREMTRLKRIYRQYVIGSFAFNLPLVLVAVALPGTILSLFGPGFVPAESALRWAVLIQAVTILLGPAGTVLVLAHHERQMLIVNAMGLIVLTMGCLFVIPAYGVTGGALLSALILLTRRLTEVVLMRVGPWRLSEPGVEATSSI